MIPLILLVLAGLAFSGGFAYLDWQFVRGDFNKERIHDREQTRRVVQFHAWSIGILLVVLLLLLL